MLEMGYSCAAGDSTESVNDDRPQLKETFAGVSQAQRLLCQVVACQWSAHRLAKEGRLHQ